MSQYLLSTYMVEGEVRGAPASPEEMQQFMQRVIALEEEMEAGGAFVFGGALRGPDSATVVAPAEEGAVATEGPFVDSKTHLAGFYIINAADDAAARAWADKVAAATNHPIEVRPFRATGMVKDHMPPSGG